MGDGGMAPHGWRTTCGACVISCGVGWSAVGEGVCVSRMGGTMCYNGDALSVPVVFGRTTGGMHRRADTLAELCSLEDAASQAAMCASLWEEAPGKDRDASRRGCPAWRHWHNKASWKAPARCYGQNGIADANPSQPGHEL